MSFLKTTQKITVVQLILLIQLFCAAYFTIDALSDVTGLEAQLPFLEQHWIEFIISFALFGSVAISTRLLFRLNRDKARAEDALALAKGSFGDVLTQRMNDWGLTKAERDVALFAIKGLDTADIANARGSAVGTVKAQLTSVYKKAGVSSRAQLVSLFVDELMEGLD